MNDKNPKGCRGDTPLHYAASSGHLLVCKEIMQYVEDINPKSDTGYTPLHFAAYEGYLDICEHILEQVR